MRRVVDGECIKGLFLNDVFYFYFLVKAQLKFKLRFLFLGDAD